MKSWPSIQAFQAEIEGPVESWGKFSECQENTVNDPREDFLSGPQLKQQPLTLCLIVFTPHSITSLFALLIVQIAWTQLQIFHLQSPQDVLLSCSAQVFHGWLWSTPIIAHSDLREAAESLLLLLRVDGRSQAPAKKPQFVCNKPQIPSILTQYPSLATC